MEEMCPISFNQINERVAQVNAALTVLSIIFSLFTPYKWIILILAIDLERGVYYQYETISENTQYGDDLFQDEGVILDSYVEPQAAESRARGFHGRCARGHCRPRRASRIRPPPP